MTSVYGMATSKKTAKKATAKKKAPAKKAAAKKPAARKNITSVKASVKKIEDSIENVASVEEVKEVVAAVQATSLGRRIMAWFKSSK
jgi:hypothetical protein